MMSAGTTFTGRAFTEDPIPDTKTGQRAGRPVYAWGNPQAERLGADGGVAALREEGKSVDEDRCRGYHQAASFYDREALREQLEALQKEDLDLSEKMAGLRPRLAKAQATLSAMRTKKRHLSEEKMLGEAASAFPVKGGRGASRRHDVRNTQLQEEANFAAQDRIMELELLNDQLRKGQGEAERKAKSQQAAAYATRSDVQKVAERLKAMPKRFTQSLPQLREEVERLEREKMSLQLAQQQRVLKETDLLASAKRQQTYLGEELTSLLDEIDDIESDRDEWKRRLRVESTRAESLRSQRVEALRTLRERFGSDAVERAAFAFFTAGAPRGGVGRSSWRTRGEGSLGEGAGGDLEQCGDGGAEAEPPEIPVSMVAKALRPAYGPDCDHDGIEDGAGGGRGGGDVAVLLSPEAVDEAVLSECGHAFSDMNERARHGFGLGFEAFRAVAERLTGRKK